MTLDPQTLKFLKGVIKDKEVSELEEAFGWVYEKNRFGEEEDAKTRKANISSLERTIAELRLMPEDADLRSIREICGKLPYDAQNHVNSSFDLESVGPIIVADCIENYKEMIRAWYKCNPISGGKNVVANAIANAVRLAFDDLKIPARDGRAIDGKSPSTRFGRVVKDALFFHGSKAQWQQPTKRYADKKQRVKLKKGQLSRGK